MVNEEIIKEDTYEYDIQLIQKSAIDASSKRSNSTF
jgi:hypothetical protein